MPVSGAARRILVVEDEPVINQAVTDRLRGSGYDVVQAWTDRARWRSSPTPRRTSSCWT